MRVKKPDWLKVRILSSGEKREVENVLKSLKLHTVCEEALCPNLMECYCRKSAAFMILGNVCTRDCAFCGIRRGMPFPADRNEPARIAAAVERLGLRHVVVTSVARDDLPDGGAEQFADVIGSVKNLGKAVTVEVLVPDFKGSIESLKRVADAGPDIINHNIETVPRLYPCVRPSADYGRSIELIKSIKRLSPGIYSKSGIMAGLGEREDEVVSVMEDLRESDCDILTIGQYLAPSKVHHGVAEYIQPAVFEKYRKIGLGMGFKFVASAPLVRSSYNARDAFTALGPHNCDGDGG